MTTMKATQLTEFSDDPAAYLFHDVERPTAAPGFVVVKVAAAAANPVDWKVTGGYVKEAWNCPLPMIPGYDFSGTVAEVGSGVESFAVGEDVFGVNWGVNDHGTGTPEDPIGGAFAEYIAIPARKLSKKPAGVSHEQAAAVALVGTTAAQSLDLLGCTQGTKIVILGGSGAVGAIAVQLAKLRGAAVTTTCSPRTLEFVATLGADRIIDYTVETWFEDAALAADKVDAVLDTVGTEGTFPGARGVLKETGAFLSIASFEAGVEPDAHAPLTYAARYCLINDPSTQDELVTLLEQGKLKVTVEDEFPFTHAGITALFEKQKAGKSVGKNVVRMS
jgi:NADPH:quinone reductase-like Zn-dependent oxidoreductase